MKKSYLLVALTMHLGRCLSYGQAAAPLKLNQLQVIGTHNSYHTGIPPSEAKLMGAQSASLGRS